MTYPKWVTDQIPEHLSKHVQNCMRVHLMKEYYEYRRANHLLEFKPHLPEQDLNMETELMLMYFLGEY